MGMFDEITHQDPRICCPQGHMLGTLQTKDLDCCMETYDLITMPTVLSESRNDWVTRLLRKNTHYKNDPFPRSAELKGDHVIHAYTSCHQCPLQAHPNGMTQPWVDIELVFKNGLLVDVIRKTPEMWAPAEAAEKPLVLAKVISKERR